MRTPETAHADSQALTTARSTARLARSLKRLSITRRLWTSARRQIDAQRRAAKAADVDELKDMSERLASLDSIIDAADALIDTIQDDLTEVIQAVDPSWTAPADEDDDDDNDADEDSTSRSVATTRGRVEEDDSEEEGMVAPPRARMPGSKKT